MQGSLFEDFYDIKIKFKKLILDIITTNSKEQIKCPCCSHKFKVYRRKLNVGMAVTLIDMYRSAKDDYCHVPTVQRKFCGDYTQLKYWGLIEESNKHESRGGKTSGYWKLTHEGVNFVKGYSYVQQYIHTFNNEFIKFSGETVWIRNCLPEHFNFTELMES